MTKKSIKIPKKGMKNDEIRHKIYRKSTSLSQKIAKTQEKSLELFNQNYNLKRTLIVLNRYENKKKTVMIMRISKKCFECILYSIK